MKAFFLAAVFVALSSTAVAGAARDANSQAGTVTVIADAGRLSSASLTSLNDGGGWPMADRGTSVSGDFDALDAHVDPGTLLVTLGALAFVLSRPIARAFRRREQQRRATALASTLGQTTHG